MAPRASVIARANSNSVVWCGQSPAALDSLPSLIPNAR